MKRILLALFLVFAFSTTSFAGNAIISRLKVSGTDLVPKRAGDSLKLDSNVYFKGRNNADDGDINLIKANASDQAEVGVVLAVPDGTAALPAYTFTSDPDTGFYSTTNVLNFAIGGVKKWSFTSIEMGIIAANRPVLTNEDASSTNPVFCPAHNDLDTGIGRNSADELSLIAGGLEGIRIDANELEVQPLMTLATGPIEVEEDSGAVTLVNLPVSSTPSDGDEESMTFAIDSNPVLKVKGSADGVGGVDELRVILGDDVFLIRTTEVGITANAGSVQGNSPLTSELNVISVCGTDGDVVTLPDTFIVGTKVSIKNDGAQSSDIFPATGDTLGAGANTAAALAAGASITYLGTVANSTWTSISN